MRALIEAQTYQSNQKEQRSEGRLNALETELVVHERFPVSVPQRFKVAVTATFELYHQEILTEAAVVSMCA